MDVFVKAHPTNMWLHSLYNMVYAHLGENPVST